MLDQIRRKVELVGSETTAGTPSQRIRSHTRRAAERSRPRHHDEASRSRRIDATLGDPLGQGQQQHHHAVALLFLIVMGGIWWFQKIDISDDEKPTVALELMKTDNMDQWEEARIMYFVPLLQADRDTWEPRHPQAVY